MGTLSPCTRIGVTIAVASATLAWTAGPAIASSRAAPVPTWGTNGRVTAIVPVGDRVYVGGDFTAVVDGSGQSHPAAHVAAFVPATGRFDLSWEGATDGPVNAMAYAGGILYLGGRFSAVDGRSHRRLAAIDAATGQLNAGWRAQANRVVDTVAVSGGKVYVGGTVTRVRDGSGRHAVNRLARFDAGTGAWDRGWTPTANDRVRTILPVEGSSDVFVGGDFTSVSGASGSRSVARLNVDGSVDHSFSVGAINRDARPPVFDMATDGTNLLLAVGGGGGACTDVSAASGSVRWSKHSNGNEQAVTILNDVAYCGGHFSGSGSFDGQTRYKAAAVNLLTGETLPFAPRINSALGVWEMNTVAGDLLMGGDFTRISGESQEHFAVFANP